MSSEEVSSCYGARGIARARITATAATALRAVGTAAFAAPFAALLTTASTFALALFTLFLSAAFTLALLAFALLRPCPFSPLPLPPPRSACCSASSGGRRRQSRIGPSQLGQR